GDADRDADHGRDREAGEQPEQGGRNVIEIGGRTELLTEPREPRRRRRQDRRRRHAGCRDCLPDADDERYRDDTDQCAGAAAGTCHVVPTTKSCDGVAQPTSRLRNASNAASSAKPSTPMMTIMA